MGRTLVTAVAVAPHSVASARILTTTSQAPHSCVLTTGFQFQGAGSCLMCLAWGRHSSGFLASGLRGAEYFRCPCREALNRRALFLSLRGRHFLPLLDHTLLVVGSSFCPVDFALPPAFGNCTLRCIAVCVSFQETLECVAPLPVALLFSLPWHYALPVLTMKTPSAPVSAVALHRPQKCYTSPCWSSLAVLDIQRLPPSSIQLYAQPSPAG